MNLEDIMLNEVSQSQKDKCYMIPPIEGARTVKFVETESGVVVPKATGWTQGGGV